MTKVITVEEMLQKVHINNILIEQQKQLSGISKPKVNELRLDGKFVTEETTSNDELAMLIAQEGLSPKEQKLFHWTQPEKVGKNRFGKKVLIGGWKISRKDLKPVSKTWTTDGVVQKKDFEAIELEKRDKKQIFLYAGGMWRIWD